MSNPRRRCGTDQKATILKRYLVDKVPLSDLCDEYGIRPNQIYTWQKILFDHAETAFQQSHRHRSAPADSRNIPRPTPRQPRAAGGKGALCLQPAESVPLPISVRQPPHRLTA